MKKIILNHKSYLSYEEAKNYISEIKNIKKENYEIIIMPAVQYLGMFIETKKTLGSQNFFSYNYGSYTGEINLEALKSMGINYTLIGHSERKKYELDNYERIKDKLFKSINANFNTVLCVGELKKERNPLKYINKELNYLTKEITFDKIKYLSIAYEPSWAIGSGQTPKIENIKLIVNKIKKYFEKKFGIDIEVYYGGSIDNENISEVLEITDGVLIGKKSSDINEIKEIMDRLN